MDTLNFAQVRQWCEYTRNEVVVTGRGRVHVAAGPNSESQVVEAQALADIIRRQMPEARGAFDEPGYDLLACVLEDAFNQAARGKGRIRHAQGEPFEEQVMADGARRFGRGALLFQAFKKSEESQRLPYAQARAELLGSIVYLAGAVLDLDRCQREHQAANDNNAGDTQQHG